MPTVRFRGEEIECREGATLRDVLLGAGLTPHNGKSTRLNCHGFASCGTCAVRVDGDVSETGVREKARLLVPPHHPNYGLRLACQTKVLGDVDVEKYPGTWGTNVSEDPLPPVVDDEAAADSPDATATDSGVAEGDTPVDDTPTGDDAAADGGVDGASEPRADGPTE